MAGSAPVVEKPKLGRGATIAGLIFAVLVLTAFSAATAVSFEDQVSEDHSEEVSEDKDHSDEGEDHEGEAPGDADHD